MFDLATAKTRLSIGAADATHDAAINMSLSTALALAETYCSRKFAYATERATFTHIGGQSLQLSRFPIDTVTAINGDANATTTGPYHVIYNTGQIIVDRAVRGHAVSVDYSGGYKTYPDDLLFALWSIFDAVYATASGGAGAISAGGQAIQSITIPDVGSIRYESGGASASASGAGSPYGVITGVAAAILDLYRLEVC